MISTQNSICTQLDGGHFIYRKLTIYPNGNKERGAKGHISIYVGLVDTSSLPAGWEVKAIINMFVHDQIQDTYVTLSGNNR